MENNTATVPGSSTVQYSSSYTPDNIDKACQIAVCAAVVALFGVFGYATVKAVNEDNRKKDRGTNESRTIAKALIRQYGKDALVRARNEHFNHDVLVQIAELSEGKQGPQAVPNEPKD